MPFLTGYRISGCHRTCRSRRSPFQGPSLFQACRSIRGRAASPRNRVAPSRVAVIRASKGRPRGESTSSPARILGQTDVAALSVDRSALQDRFLDIARAAAKALDVLDVIGPVRHAHLHARRPVGVVLAGLSGRSQIQRRMRSALAGAASTIENQWRLNMPLAVVPIIGAFRSHKSGYRRRGGRSARP